jgi:RNA polymerase sigma-70 factor (ECF subfamily)
MESTTRRVWDEWIALRCQLGEPAAFAELVREMERPLLYYVLKLVRDEATAFDVLQETWITVFRKIRKLADPKSLRPWLYRVAHGLAVDRIRQDSSRERAEKVRAESCTEVEESPLFDADDAAALHRALDAIDRKHREVLVLHFLEDFSLAEIAAILRCPEGTVKSRLHYAKKALKDALYRGGYGREE